MRKRIIIGLALFIVLANPSKALASSLNDYELELIQRARGEFVYEGVTYVAREEYINQVIRYFQEESVDINAAQKKELLQMVNDSVKDGVKDGYLIPKNGQVLENEDAKKDQENISSEGTTVDGKDKEEPIVVTNPEKQEGIIAILDEILEKPKVSVDNHKGTIEVTREDTTQILTMNTVIKNTGFDLHRVLVITVGLGILMIGCMIAAMKLNLFAYEDE